MQSIVVTLVLLASVSLFASTASGSPLGKAESAYSAGRFDEATELYLERTLDKATTAPNASVFHNLGLAFDRQNELGLAVAAYLRAVQLEPRQGDFQYNLQFLLGKAQDKLDVNFQRDVLTYLWAGPSLFVNERELYYLGLFFLLLFAGFFSFSLLSQRHRKSAGLTTALCGMLGLVLASALHYKLRGEADLGAVAVPKLSAYSGPTESVVIFELHSGAPFQILNTKDDWVKIELSDQKQGWVKRSGIASFGREVVILPSHLPGKS